MLYQVVCGERKRRSCGTDSHPRKDRPAVVPVTRPRDIPRNGMRRSRRHRGTIADPIVQRVVEAALQRKMDALLRALANGSVHAEGCLLMTLQLPYMA